MAVTGKLVSREYEVDGGKRTVYEIVANNGRGREGPRHQRETVAAHGIAAGKALIHFLGWYRQADMVVAHNGAEFDRPWLEAWAKREGPELPARLWLDTRTDLPVPLAGKLKYLACDHGFINPFPHRALFDVMTMLRILSSYDIEKMAERAGVPNVLLKAHVGFLEKDQAKQRGYYWKDGKGPWVRVFKVDQVEREIADAPFRVERYQGSGAGG